MGKNYGKHNSGHATGKNIRSIPNKDNTTKKTGNKMTSNTTFTGGYKKGKG